MMSGGSGDFRTQDMDGYENLLNALPEQVAWLVDAAMHESHRRYHAPWHLGRMWRLSTQLAETGELPLLAYIIGFHDIVYDTRVSAPVNEKASAQVFTRAYHDGLITLNWADGEQCHRAIVASADHLHYPQNLNSTGRLFLDLDLEPLASTDFDENTELLRKEYRLLSDDAWETGRRAFVQKMVDEVAGSTHIYNSGRVPSDWEAMALANMVRSLRTGPLPSP